MTYPLDKYRFVQTGNKIIALSTYAGKTVRGTATCSSEDSFSLDKGKELAAARCALKIAKKRCARADKKCLEARKATHQADVHLAEMEIYLRDSAIELVKAQRKINEILESM